MSEMPFPFVPPPKSRKYTLTVELSPPGLFGVLTEHEIVLPTPPDGVEEGRIDAAKLIENPPPSLPSPNRLIYDSEAFNVSIRLRGNRLVLKGSERTTELAFHGLESVLIRILRGLTLGLEQSINYRIESFTDDLSLPVSIPVVKRTAVTYYDLNRLFEDFDDSIAVAGLDDPTLERALAYFAAGCRYFEIWDEELTHRTTYRRSAEDFEHVIWPSSFLQFWKAITVILDEPSQRTMTNFDNRIRELGFDDGFRTKVLALRDIRNDYDVSHRALNDLSGVRPRRNVRLSRAYAHRVITAYVKRLRSGNLGFEVDEFGPLPGGKAQKSPLHRVEEPPPMKQGRIPIVLERYGESTETSVYSYPGHDTIVWKIPIRRSHPDSGEAHSSGEPGKK